ncbi:MAG TPA: polysaccharide biosynthesis/export family protein [Terriglobia bacterium]|nr:polysaccharide biosynthesis/export family protein [Terriglobia bacterium]
MKKINLRGVGTVVALLLLTGLAQASFAQKKKGADKTTPGPASASSEQRAADVDASSYIIGPEDVLDINVWKEPDNSKTVPVRPDGKISLPLLNDVTAAGLTPMQLQGVLTEGLKKFISEPQVTVIVTQVNSRRVYVLGEVTRTGALPMLPNMTVLQALSAAGGLSQYAKTNGIYVLRTENGHQATLPFNYKDVVRGKRPEQNILLKPGDTIVVP